MGFNTILKLIFVGFILTAISCSYSQAPEPNDEVVAEILSPTDGQEFFENESIDFSAVATTPQRTSEGTSCTISRTIWVPASIETYTWVSDIDGVLYSGPSASFVSTGLTSDTTHIITLLAEDNYGSTNEDTISIVIKNCAPVLSITSPENGDVFYATEIIAFSSSVLAQCGSYIESWVWQSSIDGTIALGTPSFNKDDLSEGTHVITLTVLDNDGRRGSASLQISVGPPPMLYIDSLVTSLDTIPSTGGNAELSVYYTYTGRDSVIFEWTEPIGTITWRNRPNATWIIDPGTLPGDYIIYHTITAGTLTDTDSLKLTVE